MYHLNDITAFGDIEDVFSEVLKLLHDNELRQARDMLDTFLTTEAADFRYFASEDDEEPTGPSAADHSLASALAEEAISLLDAGMILDAARRVECFCKPKFESHAKCQESYDEAMTPLLLVFAPPTVPVFVQTAFQL
ncbi:hypothetical protein [Microvirga sp. P5_D2]